MTHADLVQRAVRWLLGTGGCSIAFSELSNAGREIPDALGFQGTRSVLIECKMSRNDFAADAIKPWRRVPGLGMGSQRFYMTPAGVLGTEDLPPKWGLLWVNERHVSVVRKSEGFTDRAYHHNRAEVDGAGQGVAVTGCEH